MKGFARSLPPPGTDHHELWPLMMGNELLGLLRGDAYQGPSTALLEQVTCGNERSEQRRGVLKGLGTCSSVIL